MKKVSTALIIFLSLLHVFVPVCSIIASLQEYVFEVKHYTVIAVAITVISIIISIVLFADSRKETRTAGVVFAVLSFPMTMINYVMKDYPIVQFIVLCLIVSFVISFCFVKSAAFKTLVSAVACVIIIPLAIITTLAGVFGSLWENTVVDTVVSPSGAYSAEIVESDQGAMGGNTIVQIRDNKEIDLYFCKFYKEPKMVYKGGWEELENIEVLWADENTLSVNGKQITIE